MTGYCFTSGEELIDICKKEGLTISEVMLRRQQELSDDTAENILKELKTTLHAMKRSVEEGLTEELESVSGLSGGDAMRLNDRAEKNALSGTLAAKAAAASMAVVEVNAAMGRIVAAPTAGASRNTAGRAFHMCKGARLERRKAAQRPAYRGRDRQHNSSKRQHKRRGARLPGGDRLRRGNGGGCALRAGRRQRGQVP